MGLLQRLFRECERIATAFKAISKGKFKKTCPTSFPRSKIVQAREVMEKKQAANEESIQFYRGNKALPLFLN